MTTKQASAIFGISSKNIAKLCKEGYIIGASKTGVKNSWIIPDETKLIIDKKGILNVLWQIINLKNNSNYAVSYEYLNNLEKTIICLEYLKNKGWVSKYNNKEHKINKMLLSVLLTSNGMELLFGLSSYKNSSSLSICSNFTFTNKIGLIVF